MNKALRQAVIAGNWKMNKNRKETLELIRELGPMVKDASCGVVVCVPFTDLETALTYTSLEAKKHQGRRAELPLGKIRRLYRRDLS